MKTQTRNLMLFAVIVCFGSGCSTKSPDATEATGHAEWFLFLADGLPEPVLQSAAQQFQDLLSARAQPGDVIHLVSTPSHRPVASLVIPEGNHNARLRDSSVKAATRKLKALFSASPNRGSSQIQLPSVAATVRSLRRTEFPSRVVLIGSPIYDDPRQQGWSMTGGMVPTDGALNAEHSPFNNATNFPNGTQISWLSATTDWGDDPAHRDAVTRFNRLYLQTRNGQLTRMTADAETAFHFGTTQFPGSVTPSREEPGVKFVAVQSDRESDPMAERKLTVEVDPPQPEPPTPVQPAPVEPTPPAPERTEVETVLADAESNQDVIGLAINWESEDPSCDLDLHVSSRGESEELYYRQKETGFGQLFRDVTSSGTISGDGSNYQNWEWARIHHNRWQDLTVWVHVYSSRKPATVRFIRVLHGRREERVFRLHPNANPRDVPRAQSSHWHRVVF